MFKTYLLFLSLLAAGCSQKEGAETPHFNGRVEVILSSTTDSRALVGATPEEQAITTATVVLYDKNGAYIAEKSASGSAATQKTITFDAIANEALPLRALVVANIGGAWELTGVTRWEGTTFQILESLRINNKATGKVLDLATTPLAMYGTGSSTAGESMTIGLKRAMAKVVITNKSKAAIDYLKLSELNNGIGLSESFVPAPTSGAFTLLESGISFGVNDSRTYYLMPTAAAQVLMEIKSGATSKTVTLKAITQNMQHPIQVTINPDFSIGITITAPENWEEDTTQIL